MTSPPSDDRAGPSTGAGAPSPLHIEGETSPQERVEELIEDHDDAPAIAEVVERQAAADAADTLERLEEEQAADVLEQMDDRLAAQALAEMQTPLAVGVVDDLLGEDLPYAARLLGFMAPDDAADLLQALGPARAEQLLAAMPLDRAFALRKLVGYDPESAGGMMTTEFAALRAGMTVAEAIEFVRGRTVPEGLQHLAAVANGGKLVGMVSLRDLLLARPQQRIAELMKQTIKAVRPGVDREHVAREFDRYNYTVLPVVDLDDRVLGIVTVDDVIDIIRAEQTEDVQKTVGAGAVESVYSHLREKLRSRLPWLLVNLFTSLVAAVVVLQFDDLIAQLAILAVLMPVIANQAGNAGQQSLAVTLRGIVLDEIRGHRIPGLVLREAATGAINGIVGGTLVGLLVLVSGAPWRVGCVAATSMAFALALGCFAGSTIPILMRRFGADPATASTIFLTMVTDSTSFLAFLGSARMLSGWLLPE